MAEKLKRVLGTFWGSQDDILLVWHPQEAIGQAAGMLDKDLYVVYQEIMGQYQQAGWGIRDESTDTAALVGCTDAYYGDAAPVIGQMRKASNR